MAKRYRPRSPFSTADKKGHRRLYRPDFKRLDGTHGYTKAEIDVLPDDIKASFEVFDEGETH